MMKGTKRDIAQEVTNNIIKALEQGVQPWKRPWEIGDVPSQPLRHNGIPYSGVNVVNLWACSIFGGFENPYWLTLKQAKDLKAMVRKGERSSPVCYWGTSTKTAETQEGENVEYTFGFMRYFNVFNADQIDGLPAHYYEAVKSEVAVAPPPSERQAFFDRIGSTVRHGGNRACYNRAGDFIKMPRFGVFDDAEAYYATLAHEEIHRTGAKHRLDREFGVIPGDEGYAYEELVAEMGAAMLGAVINLRPDHIEDHSAYIGSWLKKLKNDKRYIFKAAADAQRAANYILERAGVDPLGGGAAGASTSVVQETSEAVPVAA